ncbi:nucleoprotein TPR isoform X3 [Culex pipiens pallens]|uniref:nucleoprotein TPR isoform X3 n=1 Tax=Culex pipiens pallens TaxID=42434 RepID=UPI0019532BED|nr:nucleoprotein TPR isoform X3 [Culex pipiens pallens]
MNSENTRKLDNLKLSTDKIDTPLYKKKTFDFTDYAYREAVNRLKFLLTEAYEPTKVATSIYYRGVVDDTKSEASDNQSIVERPSMTEVSKYFNPGTVSRYNSGGAGLGRRYSFLNQSALKPAVSTASLHPAPSVCSVSQNLEVAQPPPELLGFIEKQETYIEQLEKESQYCREELSTLLKKVKDVVSENEALTDRSRSKALYQMDSSESEDLDIDRMREKGRLSGPNIVFESRISELEAQLAQSQIDLKKLFNENEENKRKLVHGTSDASCADVYRKQVENLQRDKHNLEETVRKLQLSIDQLKDTEATNFSKTQRSRDMIEHVAFERNQAELEIRRLKDELERQHERVREIQHEMSKRLAEERSNAERRYTFQVDQLGGDLSSQWEQATKLQLEVERMKRIESDYKREISQKNSQIDELKMELKNKTAIFMSDLNQASAEKQSLEQEITSLRLQLERAERQSKVEVSRLNAEITSLRQRLDRSDADLLHSKRENLKLSDEVASLEKELTLGELNKETRPSKELAKIISDMEAKHASTVSELEGMVQDQKQLMEKLTAECKSLTHKLEDTTQKHKEEKRDLRQTNNELMERLKQVWQNYKEISPAFQNRAKCATDPLESDSNISSASNHDPEAPRMCPERAVPPHSTGNRLLTMSPPADLPRARCHDLSHKPPTGSSTASNLNSSRNYPEPAPSTITTSPRESEVTPGCPGRQSPTRMRPSCKERSRSLDVLTGSDHPGLAPVGGIPLNQTAPAAVDACLGNQLNRHDNQSDNHTVNRYNQAHMYQSSWSSRWNSIPQQQSPNREVWINPMHSQPTSTNHLTRPTPRIPPDMTHPSMIPHNSSNSTTRASTRDTAISSSTWNPTTHSRPMTHSSSSNSSTKIISNHMMHSSTPLSKYMMNQAATPPEVHSPQHNSQHPHPFQPPPQSHWNKLKALEMWGTHAVAHGPEEPPTEPSSSTSNLPPSNGRNSSLPRQLPQSCHFQPIHHHQQSPHCPRLSISSPSLFGTSSPESSLTPSPTSTVLKNYDSAAASPNPQASAERKQ